MSDLKIKTMQTPWTLQRHIWAPQTPTSVCCSFSETSYHVVSMERPSLTVPWGLSLSLFDNTYVILGEVTARHVKASWAVSISVSPTPFWTRPVNVDGFTKYLLCQPSLNHLPLIPGDCILAINGESVVNMATSLREITNRLKESHRSTLLVVRHARAAAAAQLVPVTTPQNASFRAAHAAYRVLREMGGHLGQQQERQQQPKRALEFLPAQTATSLSLLPVYRNPLFHDAQGQALPFDDNDDYDPEDGSRAVLFLPPIANTRIWLQQRKALWRRRYRVYPLDVEWVEEDLEDLEDSVRMDCSVAVDFWSPRYPSFKHWVEASTCRWKQAYSWNQRKRKRIEQDVDEIVHINQFTEWLRVRKNQWRVQRRQRQRELRDHSEGQHQSELIVIDGLLEDQERERKRRKQRPPLDISFLFDDNLGCPDDVIVAILRYLAPTEHGTLLAINKKYRTALISRSMVWQLLCCSHWKLPRRPRKSWHELYFKNLREERLSWRKRNDDLLNEASSILLKGDHLQAIERLVSEGESGYGFNVNYTSGIICERNSILNLAVIHRRHKVVRWLVEAKKADIESCDRGSFTPLINAAWTGDRYLVRFFLQKGADRSQVGTCHYTKPLASPDFRGLTAEGWARQRGHHEIAQLIRLGI